MNFDKSIDLLFIFSRKKFEGMMTLSNISSHHSSKFFNHLQEYKSQDTKEAQ
jgi:hypothetical protein